MDQEAMLLLEFLGVRGFLCLHFLPETPGEASQERKGLSDPGAQLGMIVPG